MIHLVPCDGCARHVRSDDDACPFCGASIAPAPAPANPRGRLGRAALFAFGAAVAATVGATGCGDSHGPGDDAGVEADAGPGARDAGPAEVDSGAPVALYGGAPGP